MEKLYRNKDWIQFRKNEMEKMYNENQKILFRYNSVYELITYTGKDWTEYGLKKIWQLQKNSWLPYTKRGRFVAMDYKNANKILEKNFFIC